MSAAVSSVTALSRPLSAAAAFFRCWFLFLQSVFLRFPMPTPPVIFPANILSFAEFFCKGFLFSAFLSRNQGKINKKIFAGFYSAAGTLISALTTSASVKGGLFPILLFPITLPIFLSAIQLTESAFTGQNFSAELFIMSIFFDAILITASSILYDFLD